MRVPTLGILLRTHISSHLLSQFFPKNPGDPAPLSCESTVKIKDQETSHVLHVISSILLSVLSEDRCLRSKDVCLR